MSQTIRFAGNMALFDNVLGTLVPLGRRIFEERTRSTDLKVGIGQTVTTAPANIAMGNVTAPGYGWLENLDTNLASGTYIMIGWDEGGAFREAFRLGPRDGFPVSLSPDRTWQAKTNASTATLSGTICQRNP